jgi:hypothetical protein
VSKDINNIQKRIMKGTKTKTTAATKKGVSTVAGTSSSGQRNNGTASKH